MVTGDPQAVATAVAEDLRIDTVLAEVGPEEKASGIQEVQQAETQLRSALTAPQQVSVQRSHALAATAQAERRKIVQDHGQDADHLLRLGMSVEPRVRIR